MATTGYRDVELITDKSESESEKPVVVKALTEITRNINEDILPIL
ncbi:MAG: hypothetical protein QXO15_11140 [Nitrososphaerota archaeon]